MTIEWSKDVRGILVRCAATLALLLAATAVPALAQSVAMVTDVSGKAAVQGAPGKAGLTIMSEIAADARVQLDGGARLTAVYLASGDEYAFTGPAQIQFRSNEPQVLSGAAPQKRTSPLGKGKDVTIKPMSVTQAAYVMRSGRPTARIKLLSLSGTKTLDTAPEFRWQEIEPGAQYRFEITDDTGRSVYESDVTGSALKLPLSVRLREGVPYTWELSARLADGRRYVSAGDFSIAASGLRAQEEALRPAPGAAVSERVAFAAWLEQMELRDEARKYWRVLAAERPDDARLKAMAAE